MFMTRPLYKQALFCIWIRIEGGRVVAFLKSRSAVEGAVQPAAQVLFPASDAAVKLARIF